MGFFGNMKNLKDQAMGNEKIQNIDQLQSFFDVIDAQAEKEDERNQKEKEYFNSLTNEQKIEYKRRKKRNKNLKRLGMYGLTVAGMATGVGIPVMMAANVGQILSDDSLTFNKDKHDDQVRRINQRNNAGNPNNSGKKSKPKSYFTIEYDKDGLPKVNTLVDFDPYLLDFRYEELIRE